MGEGEVFVKEVTCRFVAKKEGFIGRRDFIRQSTGGFGGENEVLSEVDCGQKGVGL